MERFSIIGIFIGCLLAPIAVSTASPADSMPPSVTSQDKTDAEGLRPSYDACLKAADAAMTATQACIATEFEYQDARLNRVYKALMARLSSAGQAKLHAEERKWIAYRDSYCTDDDNGGQGYRLASNDCSLEQTAKRAAVLEARQRAN
jgi:uncharacterized protein YecT (DUF1311 family)